MCFRDVFLPQGEAFAAPLVAEIHLRYQYFTATLRCYFPMRLRRMRQLQMQPAAPAAAIAAAVIAAAAIAAAAAGSMLARTPALRACA